MKLRGYIIEKYNCMKNAYTCNRLVLEAEKAGIDLQIIGIHDTVVTEKGLFNNGRQLQACDFVINRYKWGQTKNEINKLAKKTYNSIESFNIYINKYEQIKSLHSKAFLIPKNCMGTALLSYDFLTDYLGSSFVAKGLESSMGNEIFLIENETAYRELENKFGKDKEWLFEEFISSSFGRDIRFYSIRGKVIACMQRKSKEDFRANVALGASVEPYEITPQIKEIARDIYEETKLDFLGIDLLFGKEKPYFCEINVMPGLEGIESSSGINIAKLIIESIKGDFADDQK